MKKHVTILRFVLKRFLFVLTIIRKNFKNRESKLLVRELQIHGDKEEYANHQVISFDQNGSFAVLINGYIYPIAENSGKFRIPKKLISGKALKIEFIGLLQSSSTTVQTDPSRTGYVAKYACNHYKLHKNAPRVKPFNFGTAVPVPNTLKLGRAKYRSLDVNSPQLTLDSKAIKTKLNKPKVSLDTSGLSAELKLISHGK